SLVLLAAGILGGGAGLFAHQALAEKAEEQTAEGKPPPARVESDVPVDHATLSEDEVEDPVAGSDNNPPVVEDRDESALPRQLSGTLVWVDSGGKGFSLEIRSKVKGEASRNAEITLIDRTLLVFSNVGPNEAHLTEGYRADVWLEKDSKDVAARVH